MPRAVAAKQRFEGTKIAHGKVRGYKKEVWKVMEIFTSSERLYRKAQMKTATELNGGERSPKPSSEEL